MSYREHGMWEVLEVLRRCARSEKTATIARGTGHSRFTVRRYLRLAKEIGWTPAHGEPTEAVAAEVLKRLRPGPREAPADTPTVEQHLLPHLEEIRGWLVPEQGRPLRLTRVQTLLRQHHALQVSYSGLRRFAQAYCEFGRRSTTVRMAETAPGEIAECDFGRLGYVPDPGSGKRRLLYALIVTLVYSRHQFVYVTPHQTLPEVIGGLEAAWEFFGGVTHRLILDNLKAAVRRADRYDPIFQRSFAEYAHYRGFVIDAAVPRDPTGKPHVERNVPYVRENFFRGGQWQDRAHVQREAERWCLETAGKRIHGTTRQIPLVVFEAEERGALLALEKPRYDPPEWGRCKVHPDHLVSFRLAFYSAPTRYVGEPVDVRGDQQLVRLYARGELIKTHPRMPPGKKSIDYADYPPEKAPYAMRDIDYVIRCGHELGPHVGEFLTRILSVHCPWARLRQAQRVLRLGRTYGAAALNRACERALHFELLDVRRLDSIVRLGLEAPNAVRPAVPALPIQPALRFLRDPASFRAPTH